jgi:3-deoxy-7-phosphoheptulonate synthase
MEQDKQHFHKQPQWQPSSWRTFPAEQQPTYEDPEKLGCVLGLIHKLPPLVFAGEINTLRADLARAARGEAFVLQGGDCAERFLDCNQAAITSKLKILLQMSVVLCYGLRKPIIRIGRIAGQYAKPRSQATETIGDQEIVSYRGDIINSYEAAGPARKPDPERIYQAYLLASATLNYIRALTGGGFADLHHPQNWDLGFVKGATKQDEYERIINNIQDAIRFMEALGSHEEKLGSVQFYTSHEGLLLPLEESLTHYLPQHDAYYNLGAHMLWIGERTRHLNGAHIEYFRGIANPVGVKVGPQATSGDILAICDRLNPQRIPGKVMLITRYGHDKVTAHLPDLVRAIRDIELPVVWSVDPMHGNAIKTEDGIKTRDFDAILREVSETVAVHKALGTALGGIHVELTGEDVTECIGGSSGITKNQLDQHYETYCDPRLNYSQSLELAFLTASILS